VKYRPRQECTKLLDSSDVGIKDRRAMGNPVETETSRFESPIQR